MKPKMREIVVAVIAMLSTTAAIGETVAHADLIDAYRSRSLVRKTLPREAASSFERGKTEVRRLYVEAARLAKRAMGMIQQSRAKASGRGRTRGGLNRPSPSRGRADVLAKSIVNLGKDAARTILRKRFDFYWKTLLWSSAKGRGLRKRERNYLSSFFPRTLLRRVRIYGRPRVVFFANAPAFGVYDPYTLVFRKGTAHKRRLKRALIHVCQALRHGKSFLARWLNQWIDAGFDDSKMPFVKQAVSFLKRDLPVSRHLGYPCLPKRGAK